MNLLVKSSKHSTSHPYVPSEIKQSVHVCFCFKQSCVAGGGKDRKICPWSWCVSLRIPYHSLLCEKPEKRVTQWTKCSSAAGSLTAVDQDRNSDSSLPASLDSGKITDFVMLNTVCIRENKTHSNKLFTFSGSYEKKGKNVCIMVAVVFLN